MFHNLLLLHHPFFTFSRQYQPMTVPKASKRGTKSSTRGGRRIRRRNDEPDLSHLTAQKVVKLINPQGRTSTKTGIPPHQPRQPSQQHEPENDEELDNEQSNSRAKKDLPPVDTSQ